MADIYSTLAVESETVVCFLELQVKHPLLNLNAKPDIDLHVSGSFTKFASQ